MFNVFEYPVLQDFIRLTESYESVYRVYDYDVIEYAVAPVAYAGRQNYLIFLVFFDFQNKFPFPGSETLGATAYSNTS